MNEITLGGVALRTPDAANSSLSLLLWGDAGCGKTTLAMTAPGHKLLVLLDPSGDASITNRKDVTVLDLSKSPFLQVVERFRAPDPLNLEAYLKSNPHIETVVVDSLTAYAYMALQEAVYKNKSSSMEQPGQHGYTWRNSNVVRAVNNFVAVCNRLGRNIIFTTHEGTPAMDSDGNIASITMALSASSTSQTAFRINEVWHMSDTGKAHVIAVRPCRSRKPMKTRMFNADRSEFTWRYNPISNTGEGVAEWLNLWRASGGNKIPLPA